MITKEDLALLESKGITPEQLENQLSCFKKGFPFLKLASAASVGRGVLAPDAKEQTAFLNEWDQYLQGTGKVVKFVPASGAASRMFKNLFEFLDADDQQPSTDFMKKFFDHIHQFAFFSDLNAACIKYESKDVDSLMAEGRYQDVVRCLLTDNGLRYGKLPKGLLKFHSYADGARTPLEEHLVEGALYAKGKSGNVNVHFTVSGEHRQMFEELALQQADNYAKRFKVIYNISFSEQKASTDTVAATMDNEPFRMEDGSMLFRPGGHGALIENLNDIDADVIYIKNIDNVVPDRLKTETVTYKRLLAGVLVAYQKKIFSCMDKLDRGEYTHNELIDMLRFLQQNLCCRKTDVKELEDSELAIYLRNKFNRPLRVCGMVKNVGEPGGGPFLAYDRDGTISPQILESSQIDTGNDEYVAMFKNGTHFNPVDLVCAVKDYKGKKFNLPDFVDPQTGFISFKSKNGKELKALELPGLWNGAMSNWNTVFVEVPLGTFNPVKTVNDLLREQHQ